MLAPGKWTNCELCIAVDPEEVDPPLGVLPVGELLAENQCFGLREGRTSVHRNARYRSFA